MNYKQEGKTKTECKQSALHILLLRGNQQETEACIEFAAAKLFLAVGFTLVALALNHSTPHLLVAAYNGPGHIMCVIRPTLASSQLFCEILVEILGLGVRDGAVSPYRVRNTRQVSLAGSQ